MERLTYKSGLGDYGAAVIFNDRMEELYRLRNALGKYEDLGYTPEELRRIICMKKSSELNDSVAV